jgi:hypothetical protein
MVWIVALSAGWLGGFVMLLALVSVAARSDRPTADHLARAGHSARVIWLPPHADRGDRLL